ncbi:D-alpha,beta-D-heptose 1,7-bisphosphate phosphatase [Colwellia chukchiensis]|uniref:D,D-heptose 1,7-bisphosphate phosphatase n=1 Tax=Colwellia chukchiensis TaxID=641665 RepID=A0A1H7RRX7_9GAMM|nr:D-glycero-beta-D-manno-heptose 1,7-bisphosphate 7-phosphatase [Colwellia chukchiensis]SEL62981.1 D-alpha,beta-D-heptose 1,7-bisphosphate phosphatase [Colwellia chukchiensis]
MSKALFLDRDGIINIDHGYVHKKEDFDFVDGIFELCLLAINKGYQIFVITNQAGIARGYYDQAAFERLTQWMISVFAEQNIMITKVYYCPHHPSKGVNEFVMKCECRKPAPGMLLKAEKEFSINLEHSVFIGDKISDMQAAKNAGVECRILLNSRYTEESADEELAGVCKINTLKQAISLLK